MIVVYAFAALGFYVSAQWIRNEFKPKPSYAPLFRLWDRPLSRPKSGGEAK